MKRLWTATIVALMTVSCTGNTQGPSVADGGLPVYSIGAPDDLQTIDVARALHDVLNLPDEAKVRDRGQYEARIDGAGHQAVIYDRQAGSVGISYSGPRFGNPDCINCPPLDDTDDAATAIALTNEILDAIGIDTTNIDFTERARYEGDYWIRGEVSIAGATFDDLAFNFWWSHGHELVNFNGGIYAVDTIGTVTPRDEQDARAQAEAMISNDRTITSFERTYIGAFRDGELIAAPAYLATTDLGTDFTVSAFTGKLPD